MKATKLFALIAIICIFTVNALAQNPVPKATAKDNTFKAKVDFHCGGGKTRIENHFKDMKGIKSVNADLATKVVTIEHNSELISTEKLVLEIEKAGHRTEFTPKDRKVVSKCSHGDHGHDHDHDHDH